MSVEVEAGPSGLLHDERRRPSGWILQLACTWAAVVAGFAAFVLLDVLLAPIDIIDKVLIQQDGPVLPLAAAGVLLLLAASRVPAADALGALVRGRLTARRATMAAGGVGLALYALTPWYMPMSMDEVMAQFDAVIFSQAKVVAEVAPEWRAYVPALQWQFRVETPDHAFWASMYLPVNAAVRAVFARLGDQDLASPFWCAVAVVALFGVARRLWPERREAPLLAVLFLLTSAQFLLNGVTAYAMSAHLALNLVWLWLFLSPRRASQAGAAAVAFAATGLHQLIFHPLFAAPFLLMLLWRRQWKLAAFHGLAYAAIGLFWMSYWGFALPGAPTGESGRELGLERWVGMTVEMLAGFDLGKTDWVVENVFRFVLWQSLLVVPLACLALKACRREPVMLALGGGVLLTIAAMWLLLPNQGFGWGYRYLHGFIGSLSLLAVAGWIALTRPLGPEALRRAQAVLALSLVFSALVLTPFRFHQAWRITRPYADAHAAIRRAQAEVVLIDDTGVFEARILPRNDPFLRNSPKVMMLEHIGLGDLERLCRQSKVQTFDRAVAEPLGLPVFARRPTPEVQARRSLMARLGCGTDRVPLERRS